MILKIALKPFHLIKSFFNQKKAEKIRLAHQAAYEVMLEVKEELRKIRSE